jgi:hypothetical protein
MQTSEVGLIRARFEGLVQGPMSSMLDLIRQGHLEAASVLADRAGRQMDQFAAELGQFGDAVTAALTPKPAPEAVPAPVETPAP